AYFVLFTEFISKGYTTCNSQLGTKMADHSADVMLSRAKMKTSFTPFTIAIFITLPLHKEFVQWHISAGKNAQVTMQRHHPFIMFQRIRYTNWYGFLPNSTEPFANFTLPEE